MQNTRTRQRGMTLTEVLVATLIFATIFLAALMMYDRSTRIFKQGVESSDMQQETRVGFQRLVQDIRMAGFDYDRDGRPLGSSTVAWTASTDYGLGALVSPTTPNGLRYKCTIAGTSDASEPAWTTTPGDTINDGTVEWTAQSGTALYQQPDEQIEHAGMAAITIRGNFDYESDDDNDNGREYDYEPEEGQFPIVTTANDEIVTYVLKSDRGVNSDSITFYADLGKPRTGYPGGEDEAAVTISGIDDCADAGGAWDGCLQPPYTLYRISMPDSDLSSPVTTGFTETPVAGNIRSLRFTYYEDISATAALTDISTSPVEVANGGAIGGDGQWLASAATATISDRLIRQKIKSIKVEYVGMNEYPDLDYTYPGETVVYTDTAGKTVDVTKYRQFRLESVVSPRNINKHGAAEPTTQPPSAPSITKVCFGHCGIVYIEWTPAPPSPLKGEAVSYNIIYDTVVDGEAFSAKAGLVENYLLSLPDTYSLGTTWYFKVQAVNDYGDATSAPTTPANLFSGTLTNTTDASAPTGLDATEMADGVQNQIDVTWNRPATNLATAQTLSCKLADGSTSSLVESEIPYAEVDGWRVYRGTSPGFTADSSSRIIDESETSNPPALDPVSGIVTWTDNTAVGCVDYYYKVESVERCVENASYNNPADVNLSVSELSAEAAGYTSTAVNPAATTAVTIDYSTSSCVAPSCTVNFTWDRVTQDANGDATSPAYILKREKYDSTGTTLLETVLIDVGAPTSQAPTTITYTDSPAYVAGDKFKYQVAASQCGLNSAYYPSPPLDFPCAFDNNDYSVQIDPTEPSLSGDGSSGSPWVVPDPTGLTVSRGSGPSSGTPLDWTANLYHAGTGALVSTLASATGSVTYNPGFTLPSSDTYRVDITATDTATLCVGYFSLYIEDAPTNCCLTPFSTDTSVTSAGALKINLVFKNICDTDLTINPGGVKFMYKRRSTGSPSARDTLNGFTWPTSSGTYFEDLSPDIDSGDGCITASYGDTRCVRTPPTVSGALDTITSLGTYAMELNFLNSVPDVSSSLCSTTSGGVHCMLAVCVNYTKASDSTSEYCKIFPDVSADDVSISCD